MHQRFILFFVFLLSVHILSGQDSTSPVTFAIIGDFGSGDSNELKVRNMVDTMQPSFIITVGDNSYDDDEGGALERNDSIYHQYIRAGAFYPCPGNHDHKHDAALNHYKRYFGVERNYRIHKGAGYFYFLDSGGESDGGSFDQDTKDSLYAWLKADTGDYFHIVVFHHPPFSSGHHGCNPGTQLDYTALGIDAVLCGHDHLYQRIYAKNSTRPLYLVDGSGGAPLDSGDPRPKKHDCPDAYDSRSFDNKDFGAVRVILSSDEMQFDYYITRQPGKPYDTAIVTKKK